MNKLLLLPALVLAGGCAKKVVTPLDQIPKLGSLGEVMLNIETTAGPQWGKIGEGSYSAAEWAELEEASARLVALAERARSFSRAPTEAFDKHAAALGEQARALGAAVQGKDAKAASKNLDDMKATCKACHAETR